MLYKLENDEEESAIAIFPQSIIECLEVAEYARWGWLKPIRKEKRFIDIIDRLKLADWLNITPPIGHNIMFRLLVV